MVSINLIFKHVHSTVVLFSRVVSVHCAHAEHGDQILGAVRVSAALASMSSAPQFKRESWRACEARRLKGREQRDGREIGEDSIPVGLGEKTCIVAGERFHSIGCCSQGFD